MILCGPARPTSHTGIRAIGARRASKRSEAASPDHPGKMTVTLMMTIGAAGEVRFHTPFREHTITALVNENRRIRYKWMYSPYDHIGKRRVRRIEGYWYMRQPLHLLRREEALSRVNAGWSHIPLVTAHPWRCNTTGVKWQSISDTYSSEDRIEHTHKIRHLG